MRAQMEEVTFRISETKKETYEFKRDIVTGAENVRTGKRVAEKILNYKEDKLNADPRAKDNLKQKHTNKKTQIIQKEQQLMQKEEMGEVLHVIDFDQLKIENQQYLEKIEERNNELLSLKLTTGRTVQVLNQLKKKLTKTTSQSEWLRREIQERKQQLNRIQVSIFAGKPSGMG